MGVADINRQISEMKLFLPPQALVGQLAKPYQLLLHSIWSLRFAALSTLMTSVL